MTEGIVIAALLSVSLRAKCGNLGGGDNVRFLAEFILSEGYILRQAQDEWGEGLRMTGAKGSE
jgi:hypothetical protein